MSLLLMVCWPDVVTWPQPNCKGGWETHFLFPCFSTLFITVGVHFPPQGPKNAKYLPSQLPLYLWHEGGLILTNGTKEKSIDLLRNAFSLIKIDTKRKCSSLAKGCHMAAITWLCEEINKLTLQGSESPGPWCHDQAAGPTLQLPFLWTSCYGRS